MNLKSCLSRCLKFSVRINYSLQVVFNKRHGKMVCMWYIISTLYSNSSWWGMFRLWSLLWHCVNLQVDMSILEEPAAFAFRVEGLTL
jgi:hypothetical protein